MTTPEPQTDATTFLHDVIRPVLADLGMGGCQAEKLLMMTACHESMGFRYRVQVGGPALSYFQIEPNTLDDLYVNYLAYRHDRKAVLDGYLSPGEGRMEALRDNDRYACAAARLIYMRFPDALPDVGDDAGFASYAKRYWNTDMGKATPDQYLDDFHAYGPRPTPVDWA